MSNCMENSISSYCHARLSVSSWAPQPQLRRLLSSAACVFCRLYIVWIWNSSYCRIAWQKLSRERRSGVSFPHFEHLRIVFNGSVEWRRWYLNSKFDSLSTANLTIALHYKHSVGFSQLLSAVDKLSPPLAAAAVVLCCEMENESNH